MSLSVFLDASAISSLLFVIYVVRRVYDSICGLLYTTALHTPCEPVIAWNHLMIASSIDRGGTVLYCTYQGAVKRNNDWLRVAGHANPIKSIVACSFRTNFLG